MTLRLTEADAAKLSPKARKTPRKRLQKQQQANPCVEPVLIMLPYPPSTNALFATVNGRRVKTVIARNYCQDAGKLARLVFAVPFTGRLAVSMVLTPPKGKGIDIDNAFKASLDAMKGIAWVDDSQVWRLSIERHAPSMGGGLIMMVGPFEETKQNG